MNYSHRNRLSEATSPYLQQHADNPVDWWPWCPEALDKARNEDKPILLSIGYSACHWCHVMAHESFEDEAIAALMNELYVNIKVDREERPDLDKIYQTAHQLLARRPGGWPLTVFLAPGDLTPFFAGTYFPSQARHGLPSFPDLLRSIHRAFVEQRGAIEQQNRELQNALDSLAQPSDSDAIQLGGAPFTHAMQQFQDSYDAAAGGFGSAPKFPHPASLEWLLRRAADGEGQAKKMALFTLQQMALGGLNDQLGGGFCRYSVDARWMIPHFEKMLYDNGPLLALYADAWQADAQRPLFAHVCRRTAEWVMREMQAPSGGYYSSLDADSEGEEGKFYVWDRAEVRELLTEAEYQVFARRYGLDRPANFEGRWHLHTWTDTRDLQGPSGLDARGVRRLLASARDKLFAARERRTRPARDDKILTSWNALMIRGMARAGRLLDEPDWIASAERALDLLGAELWRDGRLLATHKDGRSRLPAYLDDHAFLLDALLEMLQTRWRTADLNWALELAELLLAHFEDREHGGFFFTADDHEHLIQRPKPFADEAMPSGNGIAALALLRLGHLIGETRYLDAAERTLKSGWAQLAHTPFAHPSLLLALQEALEPSATVILRGPEEAMSDWRRTLNDGDRARFDLYAIAGDAHDLPAALADKTVTTNGPVAYLCRGLSCQAPISDLETLITALTSDGIKPHSGPSYREE